MAHDDGSRTSDEVPPPVDPELQEVFAAFRAQGMPLTDETYESMAAMSVVTEEDIRPALDEYGLRHDEITVTGADGDSMTLSIIRPQQEVAGAWGLYHVHGGGMVMGTRFVSVVEADLLAWVARYGLVLVVPEYRLAPAHPAPAGVRDCYAGLVWTAEHASEIGIDPSKLIVAGGSGGGGLAAGAVLMARDDGRVAVRAQLLMSPMLDDRNQRVSSVQYTSEHTAVWTRESSQWAWRALLGADHVDRDDISPYVAPGRALDLSGLPPTYIDVGGAESMRDDAVSYASAIWAAGGSADLHVWAGGFHGFDLFVPQAKVSAASRDNRERWLRRVIGE